jgi:DNA-binding NarL/FixJ family response regulator
MQVVGEASDGRHAVHLARTLRPDVVLMDVRMPELDGIAATRLLAGPDVGDPVPVLVITTFDLDEYVFGALVAAPAASCSRTSARRRCWTPCERSPAATRWSLRGPPHCS